MSFYKATRFPKSVLNRYAEVLLRQLHQSGGRERYVPLTEIEDAVGLEPELILYLCRKRLRSEVHVAERLATELEESLDCRTPLEREWIRSCFTVPHLRIRPGCVRLTEEELLQGWNQREKKKKKKHKSRR